MRRFERFERFEKFELSSVWIATITVVLLLVSELMVKPAFAKTVKVEAHTDKLKLGLNELLTLTVTISGDATLSIAKPKLPPMKGFLVLSESYSTRTEIINFNVRSALEYTYLLRPLRTGRLTIGRVAVNVGGKTYTTQPITVTVVKASTRSTPPPQQSSPSSPFAPSFPPVPSFPSLPSVPSVPSLPSLPSPSATGKELFVNAKVDKTTAYVGEQVTYTFSFYSSVVSATLLENPRYIPPSMNGFLQHPCRDEPTGHEVINGETYEVQRLRTALFPLKPAKLQIGSGTVEVRTGLLDEPERLTSSPITVTVLPLPQAGKPTNFSGAVGKFELKSQLDRHVLRVGDIAELRVTISGEGNLKWVQRPRISLPSGLRIQDAGEQEKIPPASHADGYRVGGKKVFNYLLIAEKGGNYSLPPIRFSFFDPQSRAYRTVSCPTLRLSVIGDTKGVALATPKTRPRLQAAVPSIRDIKSDPLNWLSSEREVYLSPLFAVAHALPLICLGSLWLYRRRLGHLLSDTLLLRERESLSRTKTWLKRAPRLLREEREDTLRQFYEELAELMREYLGSKLNVAANTVSSNSVAGLLSQFGAHHQVSLLAQDVLNRCESAMFAPVRLSLTDAKKTLEICRRLVQTCERNKWQVMRQVMRQ